MKKIFLSFFLLFNIIYLNESLTMSKVKFNTYPNEQETIKNLTNSIFLDSRRHFITAALETVERTLFSFLSSQSQDRFNHIIRIILNALYMHNESIITSTELIPEHLKSYLYGCITAHQEHNLLEKILRQTPTKTTTALEFSFGIECASGENQDFLDYISAIIASLNLQNILIKPALTFLMEQNERALNYTLEILGVPSLRDTSGTIDYRASLVQHILRHRRELLDYANQRLEEIIEGTRIPERIRKESRFIHEAIHQTDCPYCCTVQVDTVFCHELHTACQDCYRDIILTPHYQETTYAVDAAGEPIIDPMTGQPVMGLVDVMPIPPSCPICRQPPLIQPE
jgi:hypothetical protein